MIVHQLLTLTTCVYILQDRRMYITKGHRIVEFTTEFLLLFISVSMQQFIILNPPETEEKIEQLTLTLLVIFVSINLLYVFYFFFANCREKRRLKR